MAATAWAFYIDAKRKLGIGTFDLSAGGIKLGLFGSATTGDAGQETLSLYSQLSAQCTGGNYSAGGKSLSNITWTTYTYHKVIKCVIFS